MPATLQDVAERAGVSKSAVSRAFTPGASVSARTRAKVEAAAAALDYRPNVLASSLTTGRTSLVGLISNNFTNPYFLEIFDSFTRALHESELPAAFSSNLKRQETAATRSSSRYAPATTQCHAPRLPGPWPPRPCRHEFARRVFQARARSPPSAGHRRRSADRPLVAPASTNARGGASQRPARCSRAGYGRCRVSRRT